jgi:hypothetical protein
MLAVCPLTIKARTLRVPSVCVGTARTRGLEGTETVQKLPTSNPNVWSSVIDLPTKHVGHAAAVVDNHIVVVGGAQNAALSLNLHSMSVWEQLPGMVVQNRPFVLQWPWMVLSTSWEASKASVVLEMRRHGCEVSRERCRQQSWRVSPSRAGH